MFDLQVKQPNATSQCEYPHKHYAEMHRRCYENGTAWTPLIYHGEEDAWETRGTGEELITAGKRDIENRYCARCGESLNVGDAIVTYTYWWKE